MTLASPASAVILKEASKGPHAKGPHTGMNLQKGAPGTPCNNQQEAATGSKSFVFGLSGNV